MVQWEQTPNWESMSDGLVEGQPKACDLILILLERYKYKPPHFEPFKNAIILILLMTGDSALVSLGESCR